MDFGGNTKVNANIPRACAHARSYVIGDTNGVALAPMIPDLAVLPPSPLLRRTSWLGRPDGEGTVDRRWFKA
jgi:hypothetical protein